MAVPPHLSLSSSSSTCPGHPETHDLASFYAQYYFCAPILCVRGARIQCVAGTITRQRATVGASQSSLRWCGRRCDLCGDQSPGVREDHTRVARASCGGRVRDDDGRRPSGPTPRRDHRRFKGFMPCRWIATSAVWPTATRLAALRRAADPARVAADDAGAQGLLTARGYHLLYTASLCVPFVVGECFGVEPKPMACERTRIRRLRAARPCSAPAAYALLFARRRLGRAPQWKYLIWAPVLAARVLAGDHAVFRAFL